MSKPSVQGKLFFNGEHVGFVWSIEGTLTPIEGREKPVKNFSLEFTPASGTIQEFVRRSEFTSGESCDVLIEMFGTKARKAFEVPLPAGYLLVRANIEGIPNSLVVAVYEDKESYTAHKEAQDETLRLMMEELQKRFAAIQGTSKDGGS